MAERKKNSAAVELGRRGGKATASKLKKLTKKERKAIGERLAKARWAKKARKERSGS